MDSNEVKDLFEGWSGNIDSNTLRKKLFELFKESKETEFHKKLVRSCASLKEWLVNVAHENKNIVDEFWLQISSIAVVKALENHHIQESENSNIIELNSFR